MAKGDRRLASIMFTDVVGYTALAQKDELLAIRLLTEHNRLLRSVLSEHNGREVKTMGDSFLVEFPSALEAVDCAIAIQKRILEKNQTAPSRERIALRIGIHLGDVVHSKGDILGDAVNVSSRIVPIAGPGEICISQDVYDQVQNKVHFTFVKLGGQVLKNVGKPIDVYKLGVGVETMDLERLNKPQFLDSKRVAVLPFRNLSPHARDEYFADGMTEELLTVLASIRGLSVIARTSTLRYRNTMKSAFEIGNELKTGSLIEGSVRKAANRVRITIQLINAEDETHLWAKQYDKELKDIFTVQSEIAENVAGSLRVRLVKSRYDSPGRQTLDLKAYTLYLRGRYHWAQRSGESLLKAIEYLNRAIETDASYALGYSGLADCYFILGRNGLEDPSLTYPKAIHFAEKSLALDDRVAEAHATLGELLADTQFDRRRAEEELKRAIELKPSYPTAHQWYSLLLQALERWEPAFAEIGRALELDPFSLMINTNFGDYFFNRREYESAIEQYKKVLRMEPNFFNAHLQLCRAYTYRGDFSGALKEAKTLAKLTNVGGKTVLAYVYAVLGRKDDARQLISKFEKDRFRGLYVSPYGLAAVHFALGDVDAGFGWLERSLEKREGYLSLIRVDREFDGIRSDKRYVSLLKKVGLGHT